MNIIDIIAGRVGGTVKSNVLLPDGSGAAVISIPQKPLIARWLHKLFDCPTFWQWRRAFTCSLCSRKYRCYWDGHDSDCGAGIDLCGRCAQAHASHHDQQCRESKQ